jgi:hypothetical protein
VWPILVKELEEALANWRDPDCCNRELRKEPALDAR